MKRTKQEIEFFRHFDGVQINEVELERWERFVIPADKLLERYGIKK